jgi:hypothetical protein
VLLNSNENKEDEMGGTCGTCGVKWKCTQVGCGEYKFGGKLILKTVLKEMG